MYIDMHHGNNLNHCYSFNLIFKYWLQGLLHGLEVLIIKNKYNFWIINKKEVYDNMETESDISNLSNSCLECGGNIISIQEKGEIVCWQCGLVVR